MLCVDVNVLVAAHREEVEGHPRFAKWLEGVANGDEPVRVPDIVLSGFLRIVTNRRIFTVPMPVAVGLARVHDLLAAPAVAMISPGEGHWAIFERLCSSIDAAGNDIPDAYIAAYAVERGATLVSADRGMARFRSLRSSHPFDSPTASS